MKLHPMDMEQKSADMTEAAATLQIAFSKPGWRDATRWASESYDRGYDNGWQAAVAALAQMDTEEFPQTVTKDNVNGNWPEGTRVEAANSLVYTFVDGWWQHDCIWRPWGTEWCDCGRFPLAGELLPATVLTKEDN